MGCDIHFYVEQSTDKGETWEPAGEVTRNAEHAGTPDGWGPELEAQSWYNGRNYSLFAMLADVRNGRGFAGVEIGRPVTPIDDPRGLPANVSDVVKGMSDSWGVDGHSHSWFGLEELLAVPWDQNTITHSGMVDADNFYRARRFGKPDSSCGGISGPGIEHVTPDEMQALIDAHDVPTRWTLREFQEKHPDLDVQRDPFSGFTLKPKEGAATATKIRTPYTRVEWSERWIDSVGEFTTTLLRMTRLAMDLTGADETRLGSVRAVFWFDN